MDSINQKLETVLQKLSSIEQECLEERLGYFGNQIQNLVNSVQKLSTKIETLESYMIRGRQTHNPTAKKEYVETTQPKKLLKQVYEKPRLRDGESPKRSNSVSFVLAKPPTSSTVNADKPNRSNSISLVLNSPQTTHIMRCRIAKSSLCTAEPAEDTRDSNPELAEVQTSNYGCYGPVNLRPHNLKQVKRLRGCSIGVRPSTMASLDDYYFYSSQQYLNEWNFLNGFAATDARSYVPSLCGSECSSELSITKHHPKLLSLPQAGLSRRSSVLHEAEEARNAISIRTDKLSASAAEDSHKPETHLNPTMKVSTVVSSSGVVGVAGCVAKFGEDSFKKPVEVRLSCFFPKQVAIEPGVIITPEVRCVTTDDVMPLKPFTITLPTCYFTTEVDSPAKLTIEHCPKNGKWQPLTDALHEESLNVEFESSTTGRFRCVATSSESDKLSKSIVSVGYLCRNVKTNLNTVVWCLMDDLPHLKGRMSLEMLPAEIYENIFPSRTFSLRHNQGLYLSLGEAVSKKETSAKFLESIELWQNETFLKIEFHVRKPVHEIKRMQFSIRNNEQGLLLEHSDPQYDRSSQAGMRKKAGRNNFSLKRWLSKDSNIYSESSFASPETTMSSSKSLALSASNKTSRFKKFGSKKKTSKKILTKIKK